MENLSEIDSFFSHWKYSRESIQELYLVLEESNHFCYYIPVLTHFSFKYFAMKNLNDSLDKYYTYLIIKYFTVINQDELIKSMDLDLNNLECIFHYYTNDEIREFFAVDQVRELPFDSNFNVLFQNVNKTLVNSIIEKANQNIVINILVKMIYCFTDDCETNESNFLKDFEIRADFSKQIFQQIFTEFNCSKKVFDFADIFDNFMIYFHGNELSKVIKRVIEFGRKEITLYGLEIFIQPKFFWEINMKSDNCFYYKEYELISKYKLFYTNLSNINHYETIFWNEDFNMLNSQAWYEFNELTQQLLLKIPFDHYTVLKMLSVYLNLFL